LAHLQFTTGGEPKLLGISKRGDKYLDKLIHEPGRRCPMSLSAARHSADEQKGCWDAHRNVAVSRSPINLPGSPGRCCADNRGSPHNRPWRRRIRAFGHTKRPNANRCVREGDDEIA
jgi:hypothetical protein